MKVKETRTFDILGLSALEYACVLAALNAITKEDLIRYYGKCLPSYMINDIDDKLNDICEKLGYENENIVSSELIQQLLKEK